MNQSRQCNITLRKPSIEAGYQSPSVEEAKKEACKGLSESQVIELKAAFSLLDKNGDGRVEVSEMKEMLERLGISTDDFVAQSLMQKATKREDGLVSEEDFLDWMASQHEIADQEDDMMEDFLAAFRVFDKDGNGYITRDEMKHAMELIGESMTDADLDEMLKAVDIDNDGRINYEEFVKCLL